MSANYYDSLDIYNYDELITVPSAGTIISVLKRAVWDKFVPTRMIHFIHSLFNERDLWKVPSLSNLQTHKKELGILLICGGAIYFAHRIIIKESKSLLDDTADDPNVITDIINENETTNERTREENQQELCLLVVDGSFGAIDILDQYAKMHRMDVPKHSMSNNGGDSTRSTISIMTDEDYKSGGSLTEATSNQSVDQNSSQLQFKYEH